jgi:hypothetical protein
LGVEVVAVTEREVVVVAAGALFEIGGSMRTVRVAIAADSPIK